ncbi:MAG: DUF4124 domain-containing protein [Betaproteobacteria bacterium]|nr:DUF4124 domain-containing protein [Betaproteobacteria bacterium]
MKSPIRFFAAAAILLAGATVTAQVYRWVDKDGKVQYSDQPPPSGTSKADPKKVSDAPASGSAPAKAATPQKSIADQAKEFDKRRKEEAKRSEEQSKKDDDAKKASDTDKENCKNARAALRDLESGRPLARTSETGESSFLNDEQRGSEIARAKEVAAQACK